MKKHSFEALGTHFTITLWGDGDAYFLESVLAACEAQVKSFDALYSRFKSDSLITKLSQQVGAITVPAELVTMLRIYEVLYAATAGKINPAVGFALSDTGYDATYSLQAKSQIRAVPALPEVLTIVDDTTIMLHQYVLLDLGALGKGFVVDQLYTLLRRNEVQRFLVDGSGDIRYFDVDNESINCGLEDPRDGTKVIGTLALFEGSLCASSTNRRRWQNRHHYLDPQTTLSPETIVATWVTASTATLADALSSALFFVAPQALGAFSFEYLVVNHEFRIKKSAGFAAAVFS